jgi:hypothetical protein
LPAPIYMILWIASYPKSGNTWLRALLSSYFYTKDGTFSNDKILNKIGQFPEKKYFTSFNYNPALPGDISRLWIDAQNKINSDNKVRFFKTHNALAKLDNNNFTDNKNSLACIYIVRDPRNVVSSLSHHFEMSVEDSLNFMTNEKKFTYDYFKKNDYSDFQFISSWEKNYKSWKNNKIIPIKFIKYEDLINQTYFIFKDIIKFVNEVIKNQNKFDKQKAQNSINSTSFEKLKKYEETKGFEESVISKMNKKKIPFFHLGPQNNWKNNFDQNFQNKLNQTFEENLMELGYN